MPSSNQTNKNRSSGKSGRGFASMDKEKQREIASEAGKASHGGRGSQSQQSGSSASGNRNK